MTPIELANRLKTVVADIEADKIQCSKRWCIRDGIPYDPIGHALKDKAPGLNIRSMWDAVAKFVDGSGSLYLPWGSDVDSAMVDVMFANDRDAEWPERKPDLVVATKKLIQVLEERMAP